MCQAILGVSRRDAYTRWPHLSQQQEADGSTDENTAPGSLLPPEAGTIAQQEGALPSPGDSPQAEGLLQPRCSGPARPLTGSEGLVVRHAHTDVVPGRCAGISGSSTLRTGKNRRWPRNATHTGTSPGGSRATRPRHYHNSFLRLARLGTRSRAATTTEKHSGTSRASSVPHARATYIAPRKGRCNRVGTAAIASASCRSYVSVTSPAWPT